MTQREREITKRHLAELIDARDSAWLAVSHEGASVGKRLNRYEALKYAVGLTEAALAVPDAVAKSEAA